MDTVSRKALIDYLDGVINLYRGDVVLEVVRNHILSGAFDVSSTDSEGEAGYTRWLVSGLANQTKKIERLTAINERYERSLTEEGYDVQQMIDEVDKALKEGEDL